MEKDRLINLDLPLLRGWVLSAKLAQTDRSRSLRNPRNSESSTTARVSGKGTPINGALGSHGRTCRSSGVTLFRDRRIRRQPWAFWWPSSLGTPLAICGPVWGPVLFPTRVQAQDPRGSRARTHRASLRICVRYIIRSTWFQKRVVESKTRTYHGRLGLGRRTAGQRGGAEPGRTGRRWIGSPRRHLSLVPSKASCTTFFQKHEQAKSNVNPWGNKIRV